ncbi:MAG: RHS repeat domain-containing protein, partial [bacterium]
VKVIDARGYATNYTYDSLDRLIQISYPDGTAEYYEYWSDGKLKQKTDGRFPSQLHNHLDGKHYYLPV